MCDRWTMTGGKHMFRIAEIAMHWKWCLSPVPGRQKVGPYVKGLIGQLEKTQDAVSRWAGGVSVAGNDTVLMENLERENCG